MKTVGTCSYSKCDKTFMKRNYRQHACCASHRTLSNREKANGLTKSVNPYSAKKKSPNNLVQSASQAAIASAIPSILSNAKNSDLFNSVGAALITNAAVPSVMEGINNGKIKPISAGAGAITGYFVSGYFTESPLLRLLAALATGYASNQLFAFSAMEVKDGSQAAQLQDAIIREAANDPDSMTPTNYSDILNSRDYRKIEIPTFEMKDRYRNLFGNPSTNFYMMVHGLPGQGKSHWAVKFADYFNQNHGKVLYYAAEQNGISKSFQSIQRKLKTSFDVYTHPEKLTKELMVKHFNDYKLVVIDSVNSLGLSHEDVKFIRDNSTAATMVILQSTKEQGFKGSQNWLHDVDISIRLEQRLPALEKSRFDYNNGGGNNSGKVVNM